jgi:signal peptidase II
MFSVLLAVAIGVADQLAKVAVYSHIRLYGQDAVVPGFFNLVFVQNTGAAWGTFAGGSRWLALLSIVMLVLIVVARRSIFAHGRLGQWTAGLLAGGIVGNLIDRVRFGYVVDFLDFHVGGHHFPSFNIADSAICIGVGLYMLAQWFEWLRERSAKRSEGDGGAA